ncbi:hypothetical protein D7Y21_10190 [Corallococcus sp. AB045]|uniref:hypothetical protein n=1 Tax=Corallococcus sp. AB045 TaxID=2316719 RepID=UPI000EF02ADD|nr:hypothetical protein [Corallococcus sp. AB045]RKH89503.1 hypothetical protein D7Y21_10190 [Corallococcus sp. AB045]
MAKTMGGDMVLQLLHEFREMQGEAKEQYARTDAAILAVNQEAARLSANMNVLFKHTGTLYEQMGLLHQQVGSLRENMDSLTTQVSALTREVGGLKSTHGRMIEQAGRAIHQLAEAQASNHQRIYALEQSVGGAGEH